MMDDPSGAIVDGASTKGERGPRVARRRLGASDVEVSEIALGTWGLLAHAYGPVDEDALERTVEAAWDVGVTTFDVASLWAPSNAGHGEAERRLGEALGERRRDAVIIGRVGRALVEERVVARMDPFAMVRDAEQSLARLGVERFDVLLVHGASAKELLDDGYAKAMADLAERGLVRAWGASVGTVGEARIAMDHGAGALAFAHNLVHRRTLRELDAALRARSVGVIARSPLLYGTLSGRFDRATEFAKDDHRSERWSPEAWAKRVEEIERYRFLVTGDVPDLATGALRYVLSSPLVSCALVGAHSPEQIRHAARASRTPPYLPAELVARVLSS